MEDYIHDLRCFQDYTTCSLKPIKSYDLKNTNSRGSWFQYWNSQYTILSEYDRRATYPFIGHSLLSWQDGSMHPIAMTERLWCMSLIPFSETNNIFLDKRRYRWDLLSLEYDDDLHH